MFPDDQEALIVADGAQARGNNHALVDIGSIQNAPKLSLTNTAINQPLPSVSTIGTCIS